MNKVKYSYNPKIKAAQKANEKWILKAIKIANKKGQAWNHVYLMTIPDYNALERLIENKKIRFAKNWKRTKWNDGYIIIKNK